MTSIMVYSIYADAPFTGDAPPGTAVISGVHVLHQASDPSILPSPLTPFKAFQDPRHRCHKHVNHRQVLGVRLRLIHRYLSLTNG